MANALYDKGREGFLRGEISWNADTIKIALIDTGVYTVDLATHDALDDVPVGARLAISPALSSKDTTDGVADAADVTFSLVPVGGDAEAIVIYKEGASEAASPLIAYIDTAIGLPVTPNGGDITVQFDNGVNKIFKL